MAEPAVPAMVYAISDYDDRPVLGKVFRRRADAEAVLAAMQAVGKYENAAVEEYDILEKTPRHQVLHCVEVGRGGTVLAHQEKAVWPWEEWVLSPPRGWPGNSLLLHRPGLRSVMAESFLSREDAIRQAMEFWGRQR